MMGFQHTDVIVQYGQRVPRVAQEGGGRAGVVDVVRGRRYESRRGF